ncbi:hypothetical protein BDD12DRAFT_222059 [Trichophaea hybrida]|nr:hypothetical protein BDD12DRAFT_222059 [Trichophaea hybrida]
MPIGWMRQTQCQHKLVSNFAVEIPYREGLAAQILWCLELSGSPISIRFSGMDQCTGCHAFDHKLFLMSLNCSIAGRPHQRVRVAIPSIQAVLTGRVRRAKKNPFVSLHRNEFVRNVPNRRRSLACAKTSGSTAILVELLGAARLVHQLKRNRR